MKVTGTVTKGQNLGHTIGFPTANLDTIPNENELKPGVYTGKCTVNNGLRFTNSHSCLVYFGPRYISGETKNVFEVYIYDFDQDIYGYTLEAKIGTFVRPPMKFDSLEELKEQLEQDKVAGLKLDS